MNTLITNAPRLLTSLLLSLVLSVSASAESGTKRVFKATVAAVVAANTLDAVSSWHRTELNPLLRSPDGRFGGRGITIKSLLVGTSLAYQYFHLRHHANPRIERLDAIANLATAGTLTGFAIHNVTIPKQPPTR